MLQCTKKDLRLKIRVTNDNVDVHMRNAFIFHISCRLSFLRILRIFLESQEFSKNCGSWAKTLQIIRINSNFIFVHLVFFNEKYRYSEWFLWNIIAIKSLRAFSFVIPIVYFILREE